LHAGTPVKSFASKNNHSQSDRVAAPGVFPYNTAPAPPAVAEQVAGDYEFIDYKRTMR
jgi:hypothetical protein